MGKHDCPSKKCQPGGPPIDIAMVQHHWYHFGMGAPPILEPILVGIGMFTGDTIWVLTHGYIAIDATTLGVPRSGTLARRSRSVRGSGRPAAPNFMWSACRARPRPRETVVSAATDGDNQSGGAKGP